MKVAASPRVYIGRCPKAVFKSPVTSHSKLLIPSHSSLLSGLARGAGRPLMACKRGGAGSIGSEDSAGAVQRISSF